MYRYRKTPKIIFVFCLVMAMVMAGVLWAAPKLAPSKAKPGDCGACHVEQNVLPADHPDAKGLNWESCKACHNKESFNLTGKLPGSHVHQLSGVNCETCHGKTAKPEALEMARCVACHGSTAKLAEKTKNVKPTNPHTSPHYGTDLDCTLCHSQHGKSVDYCAQCHDFKFKTP